MPPPTPRRGDPLRINSRSFAAALRAGEAFERDQLSRGGLALTGFTAEQALFVPLVNTSGEILPQFSVVGLGAVRRMAAIDGELPGLSMDWVQPSAGVPIGILQEELIEDAVGRVLITGLTWARVLHPCDGTQADATTDENYLSSNTAGRVLVLGKPPGEEPDPPEVALMAVLLTQGAGCSKRYSLGMHNYPASGSGVINVTYNAVTEAISLPHDSTPEEIKDLIDAHSEMALASVECDVEAASDWPHGIVIVGMPEGATIYRLSDSLVRRSGGYVPEFRVDLCCS